MTSLKQKLLAGAAAVVVAVGGGIAVANVGTGETASAGQTQGQMGGPGGGAGGGPGQQDLSGLAEDLGVSESKLQSAFESAMQDSGPPSQDDAQGTDRQDALAASLAESLGLSQSKVEQALEANRPSGQGGGTQQGTPPSGQGAAPSTSTEDATTDA